MQRGQLRVDLLVLGLPLLAVVFRVVDERTIQITSLEALESRPDVEFYRMDTPPDLVALETKLRDHFKRETAIPMAFDKSSSSPIVSLPQSDQRQVGEVIGAKPR